MISEGVNNCHFTKPFISVRVGRAAGAHCCCSLSPALPLAKVFLVNAPNDKLAVGGDQRTALWAHLVCIQIRFC